jgi:hypothetical protein
MKKRSLLLSVFAAFGFTIATMAQVPNYVPTNGLVGWWPFNGNANDESGNGNNGVANLVTWGIDRFGNTNATAEFNSVYQRGIRVQNPNGTFGNAFTYSFWLKTNSTLSYYNNIIAAVGQCNLYGPYPTYQLDGVVGKLGFSGWLGYNNSAISLDDGIWHHGLVVVNWTGGFLDLYVDGTLNASHTFAAQAIAQPIHFDFGQLYNTINDPVQGPQNIFAGELDDIAIWNRALTQQEITNLLNSCSNDLTISPSSNIQNIGGNTTFTATTSDPIAAYTWQSDLGQGFQTLNNYGNYSGVNTNTLTVSNVQLANHNQQIRAISTSGNCLDTSNIAIIQIADTCIATVFDTVLTTVTDTLIINTTLSLPAPNNENTILIYPNPASDHITIDNGNYSAMAGYSIKITNNAGQEVFLNAINQQQFYIDLSTWTGNGLYFVHLIDSQNNTVTVRKIVLQ